MVPNLKNQKCFSKIHFTHLKNEYNKNKNTIYKNR